MTEVQTLNFEPTYLPPPPPVDVNPDVPTQQALGTPSQPQVMGSGGEWKSSNYVLGVSGWRLTPDDADFNVAVSVDSLNIPDTTTANSFHVDTSGNVWWGANVADGYANANAYILSTGEAVFKNVSIGGSLVQYVITNSGIFSYGDGSDGAATANGFSAIPGATGPTASTYTLTRDVYYTTLTVSSASIHTNGYRIFCSVSLTMNAGTISQNGNNGGNGAGGSAGAGGAALADGYLKGSPAGGPGGNGSVPTPPTIAGITNSIGVAGIPGNAGSAGITASNVKFIANWHLATLLDISSTGSTVKFTGSNSSEGGPGTGSNTFLGGGGGGSAGGILAVYAKIIVINSGSIQANGGTGGAGESTGGGSTLGGGGGNGGSGGVVVLVYNQLTNSGTITATGGTGGAGGTAGGGTGPAGSAGNAGVIYEFQLSL